MKKKTKAGVANVDPIAPLIEQVRALVQSARRSAASAVNTLQVLTNFEIGRLIVEHEQQGKHRAAYGKEMLKQLASRLTTEFGRGFSLTNLEYMRKFFREWHNRVVGPIPQTLSEESRAEEESHAASQESPPIPQRLSQKFPLSWSHYIVLMSIENPSERSFYEIESAQSGWSFRDLKRQVASCLYERLALSRDKKRVRKLAEEGHTISEPADILKSPLVLEFLGLDASPSYSESDLESALINKLQHFLLELGKGFLFEARQKRFTFDEDHFFVDLVFYNRLLRCYVLFDLKLDKLSHQDLGQMQMYVNYYDRMVKTPDENPTIGILLCKSKKDAIIELTLPKDAKIYAAQYQLYLPSKEDLRQRLMEWTAEQEAAR